MKFTRITILATILTAAVMLTGCGKDGGAGDETSASESKTESISSDTSSGSEETSSGSENGTSASESETENISSDASGGSEEASGGSEDETIPEIQFGEEENPLRYLVEAAVKDGEWPYLWEVTDESVIKDFFGIDMSTAGFEEAIFIQCPMSANMTEIHIIKTSDTDSAKKALEARQEKAQNMDAFYPDDVERAASSIVGTEGDYAYFIMADNASSAETALIEAIKAS